MKMDNKIKIPWYRRNIRNVNVDDEGIQPLSINNPNFPRTRARTPVRQPQPVRQPATQPVLEPTKQPVRVPIAQPELEVKPFPLPQGGWEQNPFQFPFPLPIPNPNNKPNPAPQPIPQPQVESTSQPTIFDNLMKSIIYLFVAKEMVKQYVEVNITDPIYNEMLQDPVLGLVLREAEKANLDMEVAATYFANYDYANFDIDQMTKELTTIFGATAAARLIIFFIGRKVLFKI